MINYTNMHSSHYKLILMYTMFMVDTVYVTLDVWQVHGAAG